MKCTYEISHDDNKTSLRFRKGKIIARNLSAVNKTEPNISTVMGNNKERVINYSLTFMKCFVEMVGQYNTARKRSETTKLSRTALTGISSKRWLKNNTNITKPLNKFLLMISNKLGMVNANELHIYLE